MERLEGPKECSNSLEFSSPSASGDFRFVGVSPEGVGLRFNDVGDVLVIGEIV